ncbi:MAG: DUF2752 domain-containing protein [Eubacterium sp.]|nr:DUF2752 domain-containing protein [Eubacterium sp.]
MKEHLVRRYITFLAGLFFVSLGIAMTTRSALGTSPISAIPYTLSLILPGLTMGNWTILFNYLLVVGQLLILRRSIHKIEIILQLGLTLVFGYCVDFCLWILTKGLPVLPETYSSQIAMLLAGCVVLAFGVYLEVLGDVVMLPGDAFVAAVARVTGREFGSIRMATDISFTLIAGVLSWVFLDGLVGVREGTVIAAILVGNIVKVYRRWCTPENIWEHRDALIAVLAVVVFYGILFSLHITCPIKAVTGISCPGCGMTRAWLSLLHLDPAAAWQFHPLFLLPALWLGAFLMRGRYPAVYKACTAVAIMLLLVVYVVRMMDPADQIVVFAPWEGGFLRAVRAVWGSL